MNILEYAKFTKLVKEGSGGGGSADDRVKYVTYMDRGAELIKYPVIEGDTARDPVIKGYIEKPTKEPTVSTVYTQDGWSKTDGGAPDSTALQNVTEDRTVYAAFTESVRTYTVNFYDGDTLVHTEQVAYGGSSSYEHEKDGKIFDGWQPTPTNITSDLDCYGEWSDLPTLEVMSWEEIAEISAAGQAENYFSVGDSKSILVRGYVGNTYVNGTYYVYIIGIDHNSEFEGTGIHFGTFKDADGKQICLVDSGYDVSNTGGTFKKRHDMNHKSLGGAQTVGGWAGCDLRYDILGSTDVAPSGYGDILQSDRTGYDATETCATKPIPSTLMAALPAALRAVMKPMTKYTNNKGTYANEEDCVTATIDYLPLLASGEIFGAGNSGLVEFNKQAKYIYYGASTAVLSSRIKKYKHNDVATIAKWWSRTRCSTDSYNSVSTTGTSTSRASSSFSFGLAPIFKV